MDTQLQYLLDLGKTYSTYSSDEQSLFEAINELDIDSLNSIFEEYSDDSKFKPINLVRATIAKMLLDGVKVDAGTVESIKDDIRNKDVSRFYFMPEVYLEKIKEKEKSKRDIFATWQQHWFTFHTFFFRDGVKQTVDQHLTKIGEKVIQDLNLEDHSIHTVNFHGPNNFGSRHCWLAVYPSEKESHKNAYQLFVMIDTKIETGVISGWDIKDGEQVRDLITVQNYEELIENLKSKREVVRKHNDRQRNYFKFSPGKNAVEWDKFREEGIIALSYYETEIGDLSQYKSRAEINIAIDKTPENKSNTTWNLWLFKSAKIGDVVFASKGRSTVLGIGVIKGNYEYHEERDDLFFHVRKVDWITTKQYEYQKNDKSKYPVLFRADTFSPTKISQFIINEYARLYPELRGSFDKQDIQYELVEHKSEKSKRPEENEDVDINYWWLNANPKIWSLDAISEGETKNYNTKTDKGNKRRIYKYFQQAQIGDLIIGYESSPIKKVKALLQIEKGIHIDEEGRESITISKVQDVDIPITWSFLKTVAGLEEMEVFVNNQGSLFRMEKEAYEIIESIIDERSEEQAKSLKSIKKYTIEDALDGIFHPKEFFVKVCDLLRHKRNIILQGAPGVGKTFIADRIAKSLMGYDDVSRIEIVQFHQSYSYEDFIQGYRPDQNGNFSLQNGMFYDLCEKARPHPSRSYFIIIDEINRGNLSKIFGELMMLIEKDKRGVEISLTYSEGEKFSIPDNIYIIGTMNTADRSLAMVDYALRRRFAFIELRPSFNQAFQDHLLLLRVSKIFIESIVERLNNLNAKIEKDPALGSGFCIGHSFFCSKPEEVDEKEWYQNVIDFEIAPILKEYYFDNEDQAKLLIKELRIG